MGKSLKYGSHSFPASAGFTGSSGSVASVKPFTRRIGARSTAMTPGAPAPKISPKMASNRLAQGPALAPPIKATQLNKTAPAPALLPGYKKGGMVKDRDHDAMAKGGRVKGKC